MSCSDENGERPTDDELEEAKEGGTVDVDQEVDDALHNGQGKDESGPSTIESSVDGVDKLLVRRKSHVPRKVGGGGGSSLRGFAAGKKVLLGTNDGTLGRITGRLKSEDDEEERNDWIGQPSQGEKVGELEVWLEGGRHCWVVNWRRRDGACRHWEKRKGNTVDRRPGEDQKKVVVEGEGGRGPH